MSTLVHTDPLPPAADTDGGGSVPASFAEVIAVLHVDLTLPIVKRRDMISALRTAARLFEQDPSAVSTSLPELRARFRRLSPAAGGFSKRRWDNLRSLVLAALRQAGVRVHPGRATSSLSDAWARFRERLPDKRHRVGLSRFMSFCSGQAIAPGAVSDASFTAFAAALRDDSLVRTGNTIVRRACALWNSATDLANGDEGSALAMVGVPDGEGGYALEWTAFPASFQADAEGFLNRLGNADPFSDTYVPAARDSTVKHRRMQILQLASALVHAGEPIAAVADLAMLVQIVNAKRALAYLYARGGQRPRKYLHKQALLLKTIARFWVEAPAAEIEALARFCRNLAVKETGMVEKNRVRLRQFDNAANVRALLNLPRRVFEDLRRHDDGSRKAALRAMKAIAVELLLAAPVRANNLAGLRIDVNLVRVQVGKSRTRHLVLSAEETKNHQPFEVQLPPEADRLLELYLKRFHPRLGEHPSDWLFPNPLGNRRSTVNLSVAICDFVEAETGIRVNLHLFRHTAVKLLLDSNPADIETARRLLGHRNISTTIAAYAEAQSASAFRRYDQLIGTLRDDRPATPSRPQRRETRS